MLIEKVNHVDKLVLAALIPPRPVLLVHSPAARAEVLAMLEGLSGG